MTVTDAVGVSLCRDSGDDRSYVVCPFGSLDTSINTVFPFIGFPHQTVTGREWGRGEPGSVGGKSSALQSRGEATAGAATADSELLMA